MHAEPPEPEPVFVPEAAPDPGVIDTRESFQRALIAALDAAAQETRGTQLWLCDPDFSCWPLGQPPVVEAFARWARSHNRLTLLGADYRDLAQRAPRWHAWRRQWSHIVQCLQIHEELAADVPTLLLVPRLLALRLQDRERPRGRVLHAPLELIRCAETIDALSQRAEESLPVTTLGL
jgi:hypothetical protein